MTPRRIPEGVSGIALPPVLMAPEYIAGDERAHGRRTRPDVPTCPGSGRVMPAPLDA